MSFFLFFFFFPRSHIRHDSRIYRRERNAVEEMKNNTVRLPFRDLNPPYNHTVEFIIYGMSDLRYGVKF